MAVARDGETVALAAAARTRMERSRARVERAAGAREPVYGVSTGFGALAQTRVAPLRQPELQLALIRSHAAGMGPPVETEVVRATMLLRARTLAMGLSGVRPVVAEALIGMLNAGITPVVPRHGSVGASGDLAPLAHCRARAGRARARSSTPTARASRRPQALKAARLSRSSSRPKKGLALINGTDGMLGMLALACAEAELLFRTADVTAAMSAEALLGTDRTFQARLHEIRPHPGQVASAANLARAACAARRSSPRTAIRSTRSRTRTRCGAARRWRARRATRWSSPGASRSIELSSAVDNPVVLENGDVESTGNFHGEPLAFAADFLAIAAAEVGSIAERRVDRLLDPHRSEGLPAVPGRRARRELGADGRPVHGGGPGRGEPPAGRARRASTRSRPRACRRTTCRWAGAPRCKLRTVLDNLGAHPGRGAGRPPRGRRTFAGRSSRRRPPPRPRSAAQRVAGAGPGPRASRPSSPRRKSSSAAARSSRRRRIGHRTSAVSRRDPAPRAAPRSAASAGRRRPRCAC